MQTRGRARVLLFLLLLGLAPYCLAAPPALRVCADPDNLPFSNRAGQGFENRIASLLAKDLHARLDYTWWSQLRGYVRKTVGADKCDVWVGVAAGLPALATTAPYYRSSYVFVTRADRALGLRSLDDPRLRTLSIGVQMIGNDATNTPPAHALAERGITANVRGFMVYERPQGDDANVGILDAVASGAIDAAIVWGPLAGWYARSAKVALKLAPVEPATSGPWPMTFDIALGVRRGDAKLKRRIEQVLAKEHDAIDRILDAYGVPRITIPRSDAAAAAATSKLP